MRTMNVILLGTGAAIVVAVGIGWLACGGWKAVGTRFKDDASSATTISEIRVKGGSVDVEVRQGAVSGVQVHRAVRYLNPFHSRPGPTHRINGTVLELGGDESATFSATEYVVVVPQRLPVTADVGTGSLALTGVSTVDATVATGSISVVDAAGDVTLRTDTGSITGRGLHSDTVVARARTGSISLDLATPADVEATASTGSVELTVPSSAYRVEATAGMGKAELGIANDPNGLHRLALRTDLGSIRLAAR